LVHSFFFLCLSVDSTSDDWRETDRHEPPSAETGRESDLNPLVMIGLGRSGGAEINQASAAALAYIA
jgi:hypothetical protein